ncbi:RHS repeat-associated core domain-containing protein (plasmid) [Bernardetia sp. Wsw4-3y2]|uniref:RHS repeat-associated core domain-containing protein n=1 Tax=Bernardetia sp. Wsw4-3y2 TaxID=3127471 RepID=UPI0030D531CD
MYGKIKRLEGDAHFVPFRYQGQYHDTEIDLYYNRFRYYSPETGTYISQDPIGLIGENPNFYGYVYDSNSFVDIFGLTVNNLVRYKPNKVTPRGGGRSTAINRAWKEEQALIRRTGQGSRDWTQAEIS